MKMKKISKDKLDVIKAETLVFINDIQTEYKMIVEHTSKAKGKGILSKIILDEGLEFMFTDNALVEMVKKRKDKKYAALTAELASVMEDFLQELYKSSTTEGEKYHTKNKPSGTSIFQILESSLKNSVDIGNQGDLKLLNAIRNKAVHEHAFSIKDAKKEVSVQRILTERKLQNKKKSKAILQQLIIDSERYVTNTTIK